MAEKIWNVFQGMRTRNKFLFTIVVSTALVVFWKGVWGLSTIIFDEWIFRNHLFWSNVAATAVAVLVLAAAGVLMEKLA